MAAFNFEPLALPGAYVITCFHSGDVRGGFSKLFEEQIYEEAGIGMHISESFVSFSRKDVIRGLHFQTRNPQAKLVSVLAGRAWDVIVDLRTASPTYKRWVGIELSPERHRAIYVPRGFAHGFLSLADATAMLYQCDGAYDAETDGGIRFDDPGLGIAWPVDASEAIHSDWDMSLGSLADYEKSPMRV